MIEKSEHQKNKCTILVIDDEKDYREMLERQLFQKGYVVETAANGKHAIQKIQSGVQFNLILCDLEMPLISGLEFIHAVRKAKIPVPIIVLTTRPEKESMHAVAQHGVSAVFLKPFKLGDLIRKIEEIILPEN